MTARHITRVTCLLALLGCREPARDTPTSRVDLRDQARLVLESHCGECHISGYDSALPGALRIFDLLEPEWSARLTDAQFASVLHRLGSSLDERARPRSVSPRDQERVRRFLDGERASRSRQAATP